MILFNKVVDKSVFEAGMAIPVSYQNAMLEEIGLALPRGSKLGIKLLLEGNLYPATLININFDAIKYPTHKDILQIRYSSKGMLAEKLKRIFAYTFNQIENDRLKSINTNVLKWKNEEREYISIYTTPQEGVFLLDCITNDELLKEGSQIRLMDEITAEHIMEVEDDTACIFTQFKLSKIRKLNKNIGNELKRHYDYRCQICGERIGKKYGSYMIHAHHIQYFTKSLNNNMSNILIVCPNHHSIIHDKNPEFDFAQKVYHYPNGYVEGLKLNDHI